MLTLRTAGPDDEALIIDILVRSRASAYRGMLPDPYLDEEVWVEARAEWPTKLDSFRRGAGDALIAEQATDAGTDPIGFVCMLAPDAQGSVLVDNLHARPDRKGRGAGTALLDAAKHWSIARGARQMHLFVIEANRAALGFYESRGWRVAGREFDRFGGVDVVVLRCVLPLSG